MNFVRFFSQDLSPDFVDAAAMSFVFFEMKSKFRTMVEQNPTCLVGLVQPTQAAKGIKNDLHWVNKGLWMSTFGSIQDEWQAAIGVRLGSRCKSCLDGISVDVFVGLLKVLKVINGFARQRPLKKRSSYFENLLPAFFDVKN